VLGSITLGRVAQRILYVAYCVVSGAFCFIELALGLQFLVARYFASSVLDGAFGFISGTLNVFAVHETSCFLGDTEPTRRHRSMFLRAQKHGYANLPKATPAAPVAASAAKQKNKDYDDQNQFHNCSA
jgi:hypothetical protein